MGLLTGVLVEYFDWMCVSVWCVFYVCVFWCMCDLSKYREKDDELFIDTCLNGYYFTL